MRPALTNALTNAIRSAFNYTANEAADAEQWVAQLDGATQFWQLSESIHLLADDVVEFDFTGYENVGLYKRFIGSSNFVFSLDSGATGDNFRTRGILSSEIDGSDLVSDSTVIPLPGVHNVKVTPSSSYTIESLLSLGNTNLTKAAMYNFRVIRNGVVIHEIPLTNKAQGATQLATVGDVNAFMPNYTNAVWRKP